MYKCIFALLFLFFCSSCARNTNKDTQVTSEIAENTEKSIVNTAPVTFIISNDMKGEFVSIYRNLSLQSFTAERHLYTKKKSDTIQFAIDKAEIVYVASKFTTKDTLRVKNGDTIYLALNRKQLNISNATVLEHFKLSTDTIDSLRNSFYYIDYKSPFKLQSNTYQKLDPIFPLRINHENFKNKPVALVQLATTLVDRYKMLAKTYDSLGNKTPSLRPLYSLLKEELNYETFFELNRLYNYSKNEDLKKIITSDLFFNENTIDEHTLYKKLNVFIGKIILDGKRIREKSKLKMDYKTAFEVIPKYFQHTELIAAAKFVAINGDAMQGASKESLNNMIETFNNEFSNETYATYFEKIAEDYGLSKNISSQDTENVHIVDIHGKTTQLDSFINTNKGKVIYIDFWASWCAPCRAVMPDSKKLGDLYKNKDVVFVYISIDRNKESWKKAVAAENLETSTANFLSTNYTSATFFKELSIKTIPRYLLFDKNGKLVHQDAPGPDSAEIKNLLDKYLLK
ncbi:TlpA family protein disulfide reductase [Kordia jejudonensis]|uniref:TlpA family protein disulfide reductase n=1 Tax=Kordia jejudonensis TaxID=1348245 RepID=UPI00138E3A05|nr:TlpA disulfide reductase family protein [Kordia jejudonensis]